MYKQIFEYLRHTIGEWLDWKDPESGKVTKEGKEDLRETLPKCPYKPFNWRGTFTKKDFWGLSLDEQFNMCMEGLNHNPNGENSSETFEIKKMPYRLIF